MNLPSPLLDSYWTPEQNHACHVRTLQRRENKCVFLYLWRRSTSLSSFIKIYIFSNVFLFIYLYSVPFFFFLSNTFSAFIIVSLFYSLFSFSYAHFSVSLSLSLLSYLPIPNPFLLPSSLPHYHPPSLLPSLPGNPLGWQIHPKRSIQRNPKARQARRPPQLRPDPPEPHVRTAVRRDAPRPLSLSYRYSALGRKR